MYMYLIPFGNNLIYVSEMLMVLPNNILYQRERVCVSISKWCVFVTRRGETWCSGNLADVTTPIISWHITIISTLNHHHLTIFLNSIKLNSVVKIFSYLRNLRASQRYIITVSIRKFNKTIRQHITERVKNLPIKESNLQSFRQKTTIVLP